MAVAATSDEVRRARTFSAYGQLPLTFEANAGQVDPSVRFLGRSQGFTLFLTDREAVLSVRGASQKEAVVRLRLAGGAPRRPSGSNPLPTRSNYLLGNDPSRWHTDIPHYGQVRYEGVYPGVDLVYRGNPGQLEYDFVLAPGADPGQIRLAFQAGTRMTIGPDGGLVLHTALGDLVQRAPALYQEGGRGREPVAGRYVLLKKAGEVGFEVGRYDRARALVIDPVILYSTFLGGPEGGFPGSTGASSVAVDVLGNAYVTGSTLTSSFPGVDGRSIQPRPGGSDDAFVTEINAAGTAIVFSTYLGGNDPEQGNAIALDGAGDIYVVGIIQGKRLVPDFPGIGPQSLQPTYGGGLIDGFVTKINATGTRILYSTFLGGSKEDQVRDIAIDSSGNACLTGITNSPSFPVFNSSSLQRFPGGGEDAFVTKINRKGTGFVYSTFLGGTGVDEGVGIALDRDDSAYVTGLSDSPSLPGLTDSSLQKNPAGRTDAFVTKIDRNGTAFAFSTFVGGEDSDDGQDIALDEAGNIYVVGLTRSTIIHGVPTGVVEVTNGGSAAYVTKIDPTGSTLLYVKFLGGSGAAAAAGASCVAIDDGGNAYVAGFTIAKIFPGAGPGSLQPANAGRVDVFVTQIDPGGARILSSTLLGGSEIDDVGGIALDVAGNLYLVGSSGSSTFPGVGAGSIQPANSGFFDAIITKISPLDFLSARAGGCSVATACLDADTYPCCTREPACTCRHRVTDDTDCAAGGKAATACSITVR
jgi:hypothetical protein